MHAPEVVYDILSITATIISAERYRFAPPSLPPTWPPYRLNNMLDEFFYTGGFKVLAVLRLLA
jgi:hypothetical protein